MAPIADEAIVPADDPGGVQGSPPHSPSRDLATQVRQRAAAWQLRLAAEMRPSGIVQEIVCDVLARDLAVREFGAAAEEACLDFGARNASVLKAMGLETRDEDSHVAAMTSEVVARATRYRAASDQALLGAIRVWQAVSDSHEAPPKISLFANEDACNTYLAAWQADQPWSCATCGGRERWLLPQRAKFECRCGQQHSVRAGTLFAGSRVPLLAWFDSLTGLLMRPQLKAADALGYVNVVRVETLRGMLKKLRAALAGPDAEILLAGLPAYIESHLRQMCAASRSGGRWPSQGPPPLGDRDTREILTNVPPQRLPRRPK